MISSKFWHTRFGSDPAAVGRVVKVNNVLITIVGVLPFEFTGIQQPVAELPEISVPLSLEAQLDTAPGPSRSARPRTGGCRSWDG